MSSVGERALVLPLALTSHLPIAAHFGLDLLLVWADKGSTLLLSLELLTRLGQGCLIVWVSLIYVIRKLLNFYCFFSFLRRWNVAFNITIISLCRSIRVVLDAVVIMSRCLSRLSGLEVGLERRNLWRGSSELAWINIKFEIDQWLWVWVCLSRCRWNAYLDTRRLVYTWAIWNLLREIWLMHWHAHGRLHVFVAAV